jgi:hypothetical protein
VLFVSRGRVHPFARCSDSLSSYAFCGSPKHAPADEIQQGQGQQQQQQQQQQVQPADVAQQEQMPRSQSHTLCSVPWLVLLVFLQHHAATAGAAGIAAETLEQGNRTAATTAADAAGVTRFFIDEGFFLDGDTEVLRAYISASDGRMTISGESTAAFLSVKVSQHNTHAGVLLWASKNDKGHAMSYLHFTQKPQQHALHVC